MKRRNTKPSLINLLNKDESPNPHDLQRIMLAINKLHAELIQINADESNNESSKWKNMSNDGNSRPYKLARLIKPKPDAIDQRWHIAYSAWNVDLARLVHRKIYQKINDAASSEKDRENIALAIIKQINSDLLAGGYESRDRNEQKELEDRIAKGHLVSIEEAFTQAVHRKKKLRKRSRETYAYAANLFIGWAQHTGILQQSIQIISKSRIEAYLNYLVSEKKFTAASHNGQMGFLRTLFEDMIKTGLITANPAKGIARMRGGLGKNTAYNKKQVNKLMKYMDAHEKNMMLFVEVMYYTFMRTNEISLIQMRHIDNPNPGRLYLPRDNSKNALERHITLHPAIIDRLRELKEAHSPDTYLFSKGMVPGKTHLDSKKVGQIYRDKVLNKCGILDKEYTLYSWKHTGVVMAKHAGMTDAAIQLQAGWRDIKSYQVYLKSLGLIENTDYLDNMPRI